MTSTYSKITFGDPAIRCYTNSLIVNSFFFANYDMDEAYIISLFKISAVTHMNDCGFYDHYYGTIGTKFDNSIGSSSVVMA